MTPSLFCCRDMENRSITTCGETTKATLAFLRYDSPLAMPHWMNRAAHSLAQCKGVPPYIHCELLFPTSGNAYSVTASEGFVRSTTTKGFSRDEWEFRDIWLPHTHVDVMERYCKEQVNKKFNWWGYYMCPVWPTDGKGESFFCSELCTKALQSVGLLADRKACATMPGDLWAAINVIPESVSAVHPVRWGAGVGIEF